MRQCKWCHELKPESEFYRAPNKKDGLRSECVACTKAARREWYERNREARIEYVTQWKRENHERVAERERGYRKKNPERRALQMRRLHLRRHFGMTLDDYELMFTVQDGRCAICGDQPQQGRPLHIDHAGDVIRGLLCVRCNNGLGQFKDQPELLLLAAEYVTMGGFGPLDLLKEQGDSGAVDP